jgi:DNA-binding transcriptional MerR regulator/methylmalonyl-CoA mutase cobalamin-binding subunit
MTAKVKPRTDVADVLSIAAVETEVGIGKDRLRVWEKRYGFPAPERDINGDRLYPQAQVIKLKTIKRLIDCGHAPRNLLTLKDADFDALLGPARSRWHDNAEAHDAVEMLRAGRLNALDAWIRNALLRDGLERFALGVGRSAIEALGNAWQAGKLAIWQEHFFSERYAALLGAAVFGAASDPRYPKMLFVTPSGERHGLGLLTAHALFAARGAYCISLGKDIPNAEIVTAAGDCGIDVVVLSLSAGYPISRAVEVLTQLRQNLPEKTQIWVGGAAVGGLARKRTLPGIDLLTSLEDGLAALESWRKL